MKTVAQLTKDDLPNFSEIWTGTYAHVDWDLVSADLLLYVQLLRVMTGIPLTISPAIGGVVRFDTPNSQHYAHRSGYPDIEDHLCKAIDVFPAPGHAARFFDQCRTSKRLGAVGLYMGTQLNGEQRPLVHIDIRAREDAMLVWTCQQSKQIVDGVEKTVRDYFYLHKSDDYSSFANIYSAVIAYDMAYRLSARLSV